MKYKNLTELDFDMIRKAYADEEYKEDAQKKLAKHFGVEERTIRNWANKMELNLMNKNRVNPAKVLIYDIETSRVPAMVFWTGKQYISHEQLRDEPRIISISYKWLGEDDVKALTWDKFQSDREMMIRFLNVYNQADMVIGVNNDNFDNRWVNARAAKYGLFVNTMIRSFDIQKEFKRLFRIPSYSMKYTAKYFGVEQQKLEHEGIIMWDKIQFGTPEEQKEYLDKMVEYNIQDILTTEDLYITLRKYMGHKMHFGVFDGEQKFSCPNCGGHDISLFRTTVTPTGSVQRIMKCNLDETLFRLTNRNYVDFLEFRLREDVRD